MGRILPAGNAYALCDDRRTLLWLANQRAVKYHPTLVLAESPHRPSYVILDIDPPPGGPFGQAVAAAKLIRTVLSDVGLAGAVKTSGSKGLHVYVPADADGEEAAAATRAIAERAARLDPALATTAFIVQDRGGKVFLDSTRAYGATVAAAYSPRVRPGVRVSFPVRWDDLDSVTPGDFTVHSVPGLLPGHRPWAGQRRRRRSCRPRWSRRAGPSRSPGYRPCTRASAARGRSSGPRAPSEFLVASACFTGVPALADLRPGGRRPGSSSRPPARPPA